MTSLRTFAAIVATSTALIAGPATAQSWYGDPYAPGWHGGYAQPNAGPAGYGYGYNRGGPYGYDNYGVDAGAIDIPVCPPGYHLGRHAQACWPD
jgi:hypothetical protein